MTEDDKPRFAKLILGLADYFQTPLADAALSVYWDGLRTQDYDDIAEAARRHVADPQNGTFMPKVAALLRHIQIMRVDGHPGAEEAWSIVAAMMRDEAGTYVLTDEMREAWAAATPVLKLGDKIGARMAFIEVYTAAVLRSRMAGLKPAWSPTFGTDPALRIEAVNRAIGQGRLPASSLPKIARVIANEPLTFDHLVKAIENKSGASSETTRRTLDMLHGIKAGLLASQDDGLEDVRRRDAERLAERARVNAIVRDLEQRAAEREMQGGKVGHA